MTNKPKDIQKRYRKEKIFKMIGISSISISLLFLLFLIGSIFVKAVPAFVSTEVKLNIHFDAKAINDKDYDKLIRNALKFQFPEVKRRRELFMLYNMVSLNSTKTIQEYIKETKNIIGTEQDVWFTASTNIDMVIKGQASKERLHPKQYAWLENLIENEQIRKRFNYKLFTNGDSTNPEIAGILTAVIGSFMTMFVFILVAFPLAVLTALYLEEFAPKNKLTDFIEININNLAAVPSIIFGLLGLAVYIGIFGMPRSSPMVGGATLALMVFPTIVIATRNSVKSIPESIKHGALALGASPIQVLFSHTLPLSMPGIMTGTILAVARAIGETAPLIMIGMVAFITDIPEDIFSPSTVMPVQIYLWSNNPEIGFVEKTAAAILFLLVFLIVINSIAIFVRKKFEKRW